MYTSVSGFMNEGLERQLRDDLILVVRGNHEGNGDNFRKYFPYPFVEDTYAYWSFDYGPAHFAIVDQFVIDSGGVIDDDQLEWLENDLLASNKPWKFVVLHWPGWSAGGDGPAAHHNHTQVQEYVQPLCLRYGVDIVFAGHNHYYARAEVEGIQHVTTGGGGGPLSYLPAIQPPVVIAERVFHYCEVEIDDDELTLTVLGSEQHDGDFDVVEILNITNPPAPEIASEAAEPLFADYVGNLIVHATHHDGQRLDVVEIDARAVGGSDELLLSDDGTGGDIQADDDLYTSIGFECTASVGTYELPLYARGSDGGYIVTTVTVHVVDDPSLVFENKSGETDALTQLAGEPYSAISFDFAGDDHEDLLVATDDAEAQSFTTVDFSAENVPEFDDQTTLVFNDPPAASHRAVTYADVDNDGDLDLFMGLENGTARMYIKQGDGKFHDETATWFSCEYELALHNVWAAAWADYNQDGWVDLILAKATFGDGEWPDPTCLTGDAVYLYRNTGTTLDCGDQGPLVVEASCTTVLWGYIDDDNLIDLFIGDSCQSKVLINAGYSAAVDDYVFVDMTNDVFDADDIDYIEGVVTADWIDFNNDHHADLVVGRAHTNEYRLVLFKHTAGVGGQFEHFERVGAEDGGFWFKSGHISTLTASDFDLNGHTDLLVMTRNPTETPYMLYNGLAGEGFHSAAHMTGLGVGGGAGVAATDFNRDGDADLYLGRESTSPFFYKNRRPDGGDEPGDGQNWIGIRLIGRPENGNNVSAIGARTTVMINDLIQTKVVDGGSGRGRQDSGALLFGLGAHSGEVQIKIKWPNGFEQDTVRQSGDYWTIEDLSYPIIDSGSEQFSYQPGPWGSTWIFEWDTFYCRGDIELDAVIFSSDYVPTDVCYCYESPLEVNNNDPHADVTVTQSYPPGNGVPIFHHRLRWHRRCCIISDPACDDYYFEVQSGYSTATDTSIEPQNFGPFKVCGKDGQ